jgi:hypothetical protein
LKLLVALQGNVWKSLEKIWRRFSALRNIKGLDERATRDLAPGRAIQGFSKFSPQPQRLEQHDFDRTVIASGAKQSRGRDLSR